MAVDQKCSAILDQIACTQVEFPAHNEKQQQNNGFGYESS